MIRSRHPVLLCLLAGGLLLAGCMVRNDQVPPVAPVSGPSTGIVHRDGRTLVDGAGNRMHLRGVDLGGWLVWEPWIWGGGLATTTETQLIDRLASIVGRDQALAFQQQVFDAFVSEADIAWIHGLGFDSVRLPINYRILEDADHPYVYKDSGWATLDRVIGWCEQYGVRVVLDLHAAPGGQAPYFPMDPEATLLWDSEDAKSRTVALWRAIAARDRDAVAGYDLLGEPMPPAGADLVDLYRRIIAAIRAIDARHLVILEGGAFATDFSMFAAPLDGNQAYSFHMYTWFGDDRSTKLAQYLALSQAQDVPLWCGEFGENTYDLVRGTRERLDDPANGVSGWAFWTWKKTTRDNAFPCLVGFQGSAAWNETIDWATNPWAHWPPSRDRALQGMREFIDAVRFARTSTDTDMVQALLGPLTPKAGG